MRQIYATGDISYLYAAATFGGQQVLTGFEQPRRTQNYDGVRPLGLGASVIRRRDAVTAEQQTPVVAEPKPRAEFIGGLHSLVDSNFSQLSII